VRVSKGSVQPFYRRTGGGGGAGCNTTERGAARTRSRQGRRSVVAQPSGIDSRMARARRAWVYFRAGDGDLVAGLSGHCPLAACGQRPLPLDGIEHGRGEKREGGREKRARIQIKFSQTLNMKVVGNLKIYNSF
jgi:hypothetical protein